MDTQGAWPKDVSMEQRRERTITAYLRRAPAKVFTAYATITAFTAYFAMYAFRKPFSAVSYEGFRFLNTEIELKTAFVISQILGYALSKVIGIRVCSEIKPGHRIYALIGLVAAAEVALLAFAVLPPNLKVVAMFFNGLPLGMIWGLVVLYLEGRRTSELLLAGLSCSFIVSSGVVKTQGLRIMNWLDLGEFSMPGVTGLFFFPLFLASVWLLNQIPHPDIEDVQLRVARKTMNRQDRWTFFRQFAPGLTMLLITYFFLTAYRDYRDSFAAEVFDQLGYEGHPAVFAKSELWVAVGVLIAMAALNFIQNNRWGLAGAFGIMIIGTSLLAGGTILLDRGYISGLTWMITTGLGAYLAYVPYNSVLFDRLIASTRAKGTAVYAINLADSVGYAGAITIIFSKDASFSNLSRLDFMRYLSFLMAALGTLLLMISFFYFIFGHRHESAA